MKVKTDRNRFLNQNLFLVKNSPCRKLALGLSYYPAQSCLLQQRKQGTARTATFGLNLCLLLFSRNVIGRCLVDSSILPTNEDLVPVPWHDLCTSYRRTMFDCSIPTKC